MRIARPPLLFALLFLAAFLAAPASAQEVSPRSYIFVEVRDDNGGKIADASVKVAEGGGKKILEATTNEEGVVQASLSHWQTNHHYDLEVSKSGYLSYEQVLFPNPAYQYRANDTLAEGLNVTRESLPNTRDAIKIVLLKLAPTGKPPAEIEGRTRQFLLAAKRGDAATLGKLLQAGVKVA